MATISVLNTDAGLSGKTIINAEDAQNITGVKTFGANVLFTDATYDIGASGATRPRDFYLSRNAVVGGTLSVIGNMVNNLTFTDATYDIGASGATRPRDLFLSRNAVIGGTLAVTGVASFTAAPTVAAGIQFPAAAAVSSNVNNLDDYEEGTFTPVLGGSGGTSGQTYVANGQVGHYVKIGKLVFCSGFIQLVDKGTITTSAQIQGLPFAAQAGTNMVSSGHISNWVLGTNWSFIAGDLAANATAWTLRGIQAAAATFTTLNTADIINSTEFVFQITYKADA